MAHPATVVGIGQSIMEGNDGTFTLTGGASISGMDLDGSFVANPTSLNNGSAFITPVHAIRNTGGPHQSFLGYLAEALLAEGCPSVAVMSAGFPASTAEDWAGSTATNTLCGSSIAMTELLLLENVDQDFFVFDLQGHSDTLDEANAAAWLARKRATRDFWRTHFNKPDLLWVLGVPPPTNPNPGTRLYWQQIIDDGYTFGQDTDCLAVQAPDGPFIDGGVGSGGIHPTEAAQRVHAATAANLIIVRIHGGGQDLSGDNLRGQNLHGVTLTDSTLDSAQLPGADLAYAALDGCDMDNTSLSGCNLSGATVTNATFVGATLPARHLSGNAYTGASLAGAKVTGKTF